MLWLRRELNARNLIKNGIYEKKGWSLKIMPGAQIFHWFGSCRVSALGHSGPHFPKACCLEVCTKYWQDSAWSQALVSELNGGYKMRVFSQGQPPSWLAPATQIVRHLDLKINFYYLPPSLQIQPSNHDDPSSCQPRRTPMHRLRLCPAQSAVGWQLLQVRVQVRWLRKGIRRVRYHSSSFPLVLPSFLLSQASPMNPYPKPPLQQFAPLALPFHTH